MLLLTGCTPVIDDARPRAQAPMAPIVVGQVSDLLSPEVHGEDGNLFVSVLPEDCSGVAREVDPPFIQNFDPAATDGGHWVAEGNPEVSIDSCRDGPIRVTTMRGHEHVFSLLPQADSGSPNIVLWSFTAEGRACDNAFVAAYNAAVEITTCADIYGYDVLSLAQKALGRIEALADMRA